MKRDRDGLWFLDIFNPLWTSEFVPWPDVVSQVELIPYEPKIFAKYAWLATGLDRHKSSPC